MAAPIASFVTLPDDSGNAGKKVRTETKVIGGNTVHEHFMVPTFGLTPTGKYFFSSTQQSVVQNAHDGTTTGFFWLQVPTAGTVTAIIRNILVDANSATGATAPTAPVISFTKFTFTGTAAGAAVVPVKYQTAGATAQMIVRTAVTGMTVTLVGDVGQFSVPTNCGTPAGMYWAAKEVIPENPQAWTRGSDLEIGPGEGLLVYQSVGGSATDPRRFGVQIRWMELDLS